MDKFLAHNLFVISLLPLGFAFIFFLTVISNKDVTRVTVFCWGLILIAMAGFFAYQLITWHPRAQALLAEHKISQQSYDQFDQISALLLWLVPFLTGSLGTNLISDAITKPLEYKKPFNFGAIGRLLLTITIGLIIVVFKLCILIWSWIRCLVGFRSWPRRWNISRKRYRKAYVRKYAQTKPPYARENEDEA